MHSVQPAPLSLCAICTNDSYNAARILRCMDMDMLLTAISFVGFFALVLSWVGVSTTASAAPSIAEQRAASA